MSIYFTTEVIDETPQLLQESYSLRYQVYCLERAFLPAEDYPDELEIDPFDRHSVHVAVLNLHKEVVATARLIESTDAGFPLFRHCSLFADTSLLGNTPRRVVEVSRLAVSRKYRRRAGDGFYALQGATDETNGSERRKSGEIVLSLYKALYQASKRRRFTHWLAATEKSLQRLIAKFGFPFKEVGPEADYYGCAPYLMDLHEFDKVIMSGRISLLDEFLEGLESEFRPMEDDALPPGSASR